MRQQKCSFTFLKEAHSTDSSIDREITEELYQTFENIQSKGVSVHLKKNN